MSANERAPLGTSGFPSSAEDYVEMDGNAMRGVGIFDKDILVVDRSQKPVLNSIVIVVLDG